jgi:AcrR family transcriptional regulator
MVETDATPDPTSDDVVDAATDDGAPDWRQRAVSRSLTAARTRGEKRAQRFLDAAFELMDDKGSTEFTIQEVIDRSQQSLRGFYQYFDGKDDLLLAVFEETMREALDDLRAAVDAESAPLDQLRAFVLRLHEWCEPPDKPRKRGRHNRRPINDFTVQLAVKNPDRVRDTMAPMALLLRELVEAANDAGAITVPDSKRAAGLVQQLVMYSWLGNRLTQNPRARLTAEETWDFCLHGLRG